MKIEEINQKIRKLNLPDKLKDAILGLIDAKTSYDMERFISSIDSLKNELKTENNSLKNEFKTETESLRNELKMENESLRSDLNAKSDILRNQTENLRNELKMENESLRSDLNTKSDSLKREMQIVLWFVGIALALITLIITIKS